MVQLSTKGTVLSVWPHTDRTVLFVCVWAYLNLCLNSVWKVFEV